MFSSNFSSTSSRYQDARLTTACFKTAILVNKLDVNLVSRASVVERGTEGPGKGWLSHDQIFQYIWKIYYGS